MLQVIENVLPPDALRSLRTRLHDAPWRSGAATAGDVARAVKHNRQADDTAPAVRALAEELATRLGADARLVAAALPAAIHPPRFNRYGVGEQYGTHVDAAVMWPAGHGRPLRCDLSLTLFLSDPADYDGGVLEIETSYGVQEVKLPAGDLVLYPARSLHRVSPVTRGERLAMFTWIESLVSDEMLRQCLFELDESIRALRGAGQTAATALRLTGVYHNLLRHCASR